MIVAIQEARPAFWTARMNGEQREQSRAVGEKCERLRFCRVYRLPDTSNSFFGRSSCLLRSVVKYK